jgi:hypothetical protein
MKIRMFSWLCHQSEAIVQAKIKTLFFMMIKINQA